MVRLTTACAAALLAVWSSARASEPAHSAELDEMIARQAKRHGVPEKLVRRIVMRESRYNPRARNHSYWGLMQISYPTARSMGFKGSPNDLLDPLVNLTYAVPYLANAFIIAGKQEDAAVRLYASGYYTTAKNRSLLGQLRTAESEPMVPQESFLTATALPVSNLIKAVVNGPQTAEAVATNSPPGPQVVDGGRSSGPETPMVSGKNGYAPPKRWVRDGGVTLVGRGEQRIEQVAAYNPPAAGENMPQSRSGRHAGRGHGRKLSEFAALDMPPAGAQAYAAPVSPSAPESGPQSAIAQVTSAPASGPPAAGAGPDAPTSNIKPVKTAHRKTTRRRSAAAKTTEPDDPRPVASAAEAALADAADPPAKPTARKIHSVAGKKAPRPVSVAVQAAEAPALNPKP